MLLRSIKPLVLVPQPQCVFLPVAHEITPVYLFTYLIIWIAQWLGWYPSLFYSSRADALNPDLIVCDTFTNNPDPETMDPGCVVHQALGLPRRMGIPFNKQMKLKTKTKKKNENITRIALWSELVLAVDSGNDVAAYVGPVFGLYEFELLGLQVLNFFYCFNVIYYSSECQMKNGKKKWLLKKMFHLLLSGLHLIWLFN